MDNAWASQVSLCISQTILNTFHSYFTYTRWAVSKVKKPRSRAIMETIQCQTSLYALRLPQQISQNNYRYPCIPIAKRWAKMYFSRLIIQQSETKLFNMQYTKEAPTYFQISKIISRLTDSKLNCISWREGFALFYLFSIKMVFELIRLGGQGFSDLGIFLCISCVLCTI